MELNVDVYIYNYIKTITSEQGMLFIYVFFPDA